MVRRGMPEGSRFGAGDGILKDMGLSSSSPVLQRVRKDGDGMRGTGDVATVYGEGESRGNAARVIWSFGHLAYRPKTEVETSSVARVQSRPTQNRGDTWSRVGIRDLEDTARGPRRDGGRDSGVVGWMELQVAFVDPRDPGRWAKMASPLHHADAQMRPPPGCQAKTPTERRIRLDVRQTGAHLYETRQVSSDVCSLLINHAEAPRLQGWLACPAVLDPLHSERRHALANPPRRPGTTAVLQPGRDGIALKPPAERCQPMGASSTPILLASRQFPQAIEPPFRRLWHLENLEQSRR